ncbi:unnamed protein product [Rangifer tarandus platyrhynchus]|uniref:Uncharacterized protein n=2 Tax=Rangifer tarandus platyrhynchus TaxID=3082113 RepID=A0AC59ZMX5_RANTA|nr:unnamed protein product [Rangifer tarandus platyrhynchus]
MVKRLPAMRETRVRSLGWEDPLEKGMATHSSTLAWKIPWTEEPGRLQSMGSQSRSRLGDFTHSLKNTVTPRLRESSCSTEVSLLAGCLLEPPSLQRPVGLGRKLLLFCSFDEESLLGRLTISIGYISIWVCPLHGTERQSEVQTCPESWTVFNKPAS